MFLVSRILVLALFLTSPLFGQEKPYVVLVSFDGMRYDQIEKFNPPNFQAFRSKGSHARGLIPTFPSKTFPNHYSIVTGLYPGHHGLVDNYFFDPARGEFYSMKNKETLLDPYYYNGLPIWRLASAHGMVTASYFWVGSEVPADGYHPDYYFPYNHHVPFEERVDQVLEWLALPEPERPQLIMLYFSSPDEEADTFGPEAAETREAVLAVDRILGRLMTGLADLELPVNVILVSDHGMLQVQPREENYIFLGELFPGNSEAIRVVNGGSQVHVYTQNPEQADSLQRRLKAVLKNADVYKQAEFPARWHYENQRSGDLLLVAHPHHYFREGDRQSTDESSPEEKMGMHGYDPHLVPEMNGIFYAQGPHIKPGIVLPAFENVHIYALLAEILELPAPATDSRFKVLKPIFRQPKKAGIR